MRTLRRILAPLLAGCSCAFAGLRVEVLKGEGGNNQSGRIGQAIVLRVSDETGKPVVGAAVIFTSPAAGCSVDFGPNARAAQGQTDETGVAISPSPRGAGGNGPVDIGVLVEKAGETVNVVVHQMNVGFSANPPARDLDLKKLPVAGEIKGRRVVRIYVTDAAGQPVAGATLSLWNPLQQSGASLTAVSRTDGTAEFSLDARSVKGVPEVLIRAAVNGLVASRFIPLD